MNWTEEKVTKLKELWGKGNTASQIAEIIGGISRNAVIGKAHRLNLSAKIKTRTATSNENYNSSLNEKNRNIKRGRKSKFKSLIIEKDFELYQKLLNKFAKKKITIINDDALKYDFSKLKNFKSVDHLNDDELYELIKKISDELNCGILLISHDLHTVMSATDHVVCLNGHVCCSGSPIDVAKNNEYKALFGEQASQILSRYEHRHDHIHTSEGEIKKN